MAGVLLCKNDPEEVFPGATSRNESPASRRSCFFFLFFFGDYCAGFFEFIRVLRPSPTTVFHEIRGGKKYRGEFKGKLETDAAVIQIQSGSSIDLARAKHLIFYSSDFSYFNHDQICYRIKSYNTKQANYYYLLTEKTVDEQIYKAVRTKARVADIVCDVYRRDPNVRISRKAGNRQASA